MVLIKRVIFLLLLILPSLVQAQEENFNSYANIEVDVFVNSNISIDYLKKTSNIEYLEVELGIFPREDEIQSLKSKKIFSSPEAEIDEKENLFFRWDDVEEKYLFYSFDGTVNVKNNFEKISDRIPFPIEDLSADTMKYVEFTEFIDANDEIKDKASEIVEGENDLYIATYKLADWVKQNVNYNLTTLTADAVQKSSWVFENKQGVCDELTNLFISMARSVGIPARFAAGEVYTNLYYDFGNHGWAEVYFPGYGWVPFDVTFGEYGWIDPGHVKLVESADYGKSSAVYYTWQSRDVEVSPSSLDVKTEVLSKSGAAGGFVKLDIKPIISKAKFGSYVPIEVNVENKNDFYLPLTLVITKAPELVEGENIFTLLKPKETKKFYWIAKIQDNLDEKYVYKSYLEVKTNFNEVSKGEIEYSEDYDLYSLENAEEIISRYVEVDKKQPFTDIELNCSWDKSNYYDGENAEISCLIKNNGNVNLKDIKVCLDSECKAISLRITEETEVNLNTKVFYNKDVRIDLISDDFSKSKILQLKIVRIPKVELEYLGDREFSYSEANDFTLKLNTNTKVFDVKLDVNGKTIDIGDLNEDFKQNFEFKGKDVKYGLIITIKYKDELGKEYETKTEEDVFVINVPFYVKIVNYLKNLF